MFALDAVRQDSDQVHTHRDRLEFYWPGQQRSSSTSCGTHLWRFHRQQRSEPGASSSEPPPSCCGTQTRPAGTSSAPALSVCAWTEATEVERAVLKIYNIYTDAFSIGVSPIHSNTYIFCFRPQFSVSLSSLIVYVRGSTRSSVWGNFNILDLGKDCCC